MLLQLHGRALRALSPSSNIPFIGRVCEFDDVPCAERGKEILLLRTSTAHLPPGFRAYLLQAEGSPIGECRDVFVLGSKMHYLAHGDVVRIDPQRESVSTLYRRSSPSNSFLVTERCDNHCVMCSQPPKERDDSWLLDELQQVVPLISPETAELGITGGEPTLLGDRFLGFVEQLKVQLPTTAVHVLTNGRRFADAKFARRLRALAHPDLMLGIPLYSDLSEAHDYVVQAKGAFSETVRGILNLKQHGLRVEARFVVHADTYRRLPEFSRFLTRNLLFLDHVAIMGLELTGFARANLEALWVDPLDYQEPLADAVHALDRAGMNVSIYNHQLCVLDSTLHKFARKSISDWKNMYAEVCDGCSGRDECGGFFASSELRRSRGIRPMISATVETSEAG